MVVESMLEDVAGPAVVGVAVVGGRENFSNLRIVLALG